MDDLIEALQIFRRYGNPPYPTHCEHDVMYIVGIQPRDVSEDDQATLKELGFFVAGLGGIDYDPDEALFQSFKFGSA